MLNQSFKSEFLRQLNDEELPLDKRLLMAFGALISHDLLLPNKEQIVIDWFADYLKKHVICLKSILKMLTKCFKSDWLLTFSGSLEASKLIEVISELDDSNKIKHRKQLIGCLLLILKNFGFQRFCRFEIQPMCQATVLICQLMSNSCSSTDSLENSIIDDEDELSLNSRLEELFECINNIHKLTQQRSELKLHFVNHLLPRLLQFGCNLQESSTFQNLAEELIIGEDTEAFFKAFKSKSTESVQGHLKALVKLITENQTKCDVVKLNAVLFDVYVQISLKKPKNNFSHLSLFYILTKIAGFPIELPYDVVDNFGSVPNLSILRELLVVFQKHNVPASSESEEGVLSSFLVVVLRQLVSGEYELSSDLLKTVNNLFKVYPESVRLVFSRFLLNIVFVRKVSHKIARSYNSLLMDVVKIFANLNQLDKFFSLLFQGAVLMTKDDNTLKITSEMVLSRGFYTVLSEKIVSLTGNQLKTILICLRKVFNKGCVSLVETNTSASPNFCLLLELVVQVLCHILENAPIFVSTRWKIMDAEIRSLAHDVQRFGNAVTASDETSYHLGFLQLVRTMVGIELSVNQYVISMSTEKILPVVKSKDKSNSVANIAKSHGFLSPVEWKHVSELVMESYDDRLKHCWFDLLVQKYVRLGDPEVITHLILTADNEWLWETVSQLSSCVPLKQLELYTEHLLGAIPITADVQRHLLHAAALSHINIVTNRTFRTALNLQAMKQMSKHLPDKQAVSRNMVKLLDFHAVIKHESNKNQHTAEEKPQALSAMAAALTQVMNKCLWEEHTSQLTDETREYLTGLVDLLAVTSPHSLKTETKRLICLTLMGLAYDLRAEESLLHNVLENVLGCVDDNSCVFAESLDRRVLVYWLATVVPPSFTLKEQLTHTALTKVIPSLDQGVEGMTQVLQEHEDLLCALLECITIVQPNKGVSNQSDIHKLLKTLLPLASAVVKKPKTKFLRLFAAAIKAEVIFLKKKPSIFLQHLPDYLEILFRKFSENAVVEPNATELIDFTLRLKADVEADVVDKVFKSMTRELCKPNLCPMLCYPTTVQSFLESLPTDRLDNILTDIYNHQLESLKSDSGVSSVNNTCELWDIVINSHLSRDKSKVAQRQKMLIKVLSECQSVLEEDITRIPPVVLQLLHSISASKSVVLTRKLLDVMLVILGLVPTDTETHLLPECLKVLGSIINSRVEFIFDRIPVFLQRMRKFVKSLVLMSTTANSNSLTFNSVSSSSMNQVTRIIKTMSDQHPKHFSRIAPYLIADILDLLVSYSVETSIKEELQNCVCNLLSICDQHGIQLLQNLLPLPSVEMFKTVSTTYRKSYKYTGKV